MGLDSFWKCKKKIKFDPPLKLIGGMFSGHGEGSFRGKVYDLFIYDISDISLYQSEISNADVVRIADALDKHVCDDSCNFDDDAHANLNDLRRMFRTYADAGAVLIGWW